MNDKYRQEFKFYVGMVCSHHVECLQVRMIVERLVRRLGYDTVADCIPEDDRKLLTHIRKDQARKQKKKGESPDGSMVGSGNAHINPLHHCFLSRSESIPDRLLFLYRGVLPSLLPLPSFH